MKKPHNFRELSDVQCTHPGCTKRIKMNVLERKPGADLCYKHFKLRKQQSQTSKKQK